jgi:multidrug efflux pump subunit AcrB
MAGFVPIGFAKSAAGEYTFSIFAVVSIAVVASWFVAVLFIPLLGVAFLSPPQTAQRTEPSAAIRVFRRILVAAMRMRWITILVTLACFVISLNAFPHVPRQFFPSSDRPELLVDLRLPQNASIYASSDRSAKLDEILSKDPDVEKWSTYVGRGAIRFYLPLNVELPNDFFSQFVVVAKDVAARERLRTKLERVLQDDFPGAVSRIVPLELGPPVGWPVQYRVSGPNVNEVRDIAFLLAEIVASDGRTRRVNFDWIEPGRKIRVRIDQDQARLLGLSSESIAAKMNTVMSGAAVTQVRDGIYLIDVVMRATDEQRLSLSTLRNLQFPLPNGRTVPLGVFAVLDFEQEFPLIWRRDAVPTLTVQADVAQGASPEAVVNALAPAVAKLEASLPRSYHIAVGGTVEESAQSQASVYAVVPLMLFITITLLMMQLQSFSLRRPDGTHRRGRRTADFQQAARLRGNSRHLVAAGDDCAQRRDPDRSGRDCPGRGQGDMGRRRRGGDVPIPPDHVDGDIDRSRPDPDRAHHILGADGLRDHGGLAGGDAADAAVSSRTLRCLVSRQRAGRRRAGPTRTICGGDLTLPRLRVSTVLRCRMAMLLTHA